MSFKDDLRDDLDLFLNIDEFAETITYKGAPIKGIFDNAFVVDSQDGVEVETVQPQVIAKTSDISTLVHGDTMTISSVVYNVVGIQPDGTGITIVLLSQD